MTIMQIIANFEDVIAYGYIALMLMFIWLAYR